VIAENRRYVTIFHRKVFLSCLLAGLFGPIATGQPAAESKVYVLGLLQDKLLMFGANANGNVSPLATIAGGETKLNGPHALAFDAQRNLYVLNEGFMGSINIYAPNVAGNARPIRAIEGFNTGLRDGPEYLAVDRAGNIYVSESLARDGNGPAKTVYSDEVLVFAAGANGDVKPVRTIKGPATRLDGARGIAVDTAGNLYVANCGVYVDDRNTDMRVAVYALGANGNVTPIRTIEGPRTGLNRPFFVALDLAGNLHVANLRGYQKGVTITVYAPGASGDARPLRTIQGPPMHAAGDMGNAVAVDGAGNVYLNDLDGHAVQVYGPGADGATPPIRTIKGPNTQLRNPRFIAVWPLGPASANQPSATAPAPQPNPPAQSGGRVTGVRQVAVRPSPNYKGPTPAKFEFVFAIATDGPVDVKYVLVNQDDRAWESGSLSFAAAGRQELVLPVKVGVPPAKPFQGWTKLIVAYGADKIESGQVPITADCRNPAARTPE
jgi:hypothetical protein